MAKTKSAGSSSLGRDALPKYLGIKITDGQAVRIGMMIIKQRGTRLLAGKNVKRAGDDSLYSLKDGVVRFTAKKIKRFDGSRRLATVVSVEA